MDWMTYVSKTFDMFPPKLNEVYHFSPQWNVVFVPTSLHDTNIWLESVSCAKIHLIYFVSDIDCLSHYCHHYSLLLPSYSLHRTVIYLNLKMYLQSKNKFAVNEISWFSEFWRRPLCQQRPSFMGVFKDLCSTSLLLRILWELPRIFVDSSSKWSSPPLDAVDALPDVPLVVLLHVEMHAGVVLPQRVVRVRPRHRPKL